MTLAKYFSKSYWKAHWKRRKTGNPPKLQPPFLQPSPAQDDVLGPLSEDINVPSLAHTIRDASAGGSFDSPTSQSIPEVDAAVRVGQCSEDIHINLPSPTPGVHNVNLSGSRVSSELPSSLQPTNGHIVTQSGFRVMPPVAPQVIASQKMFVVVDGTISALDQSIHTSIEGNNNHVFVQPNATNGYARALTRLQESANHFADLDSNTRYPPPRCHPGTRKRLISEVMEWLADGAEHRGKQVLWLHGVAGSGKSAFAQTLAERVKENDMLGGTFFFSKSHKRDDYRTVPPTIAYRLTMADGNFRSEVSRIMNEDPTLLKASFVGQLEKLIARPLRQIQVKKKLLIILDGLDQCDGIQDQVRLAETLVNIFGCSSLPVCWMICSRPEPHLKRVFGRADIREFCWTEELSVCSQEAKEDLELYIRYKLKEIGCKNRDVLDVIDWPGEDRVLKVIHASSGLFSFFATIERFIDNDYYPNPEDLLERVMERLKKSEGKEIMSKDPLEILSDLKL